MLNDSWNKTEPLTWPAFRKILFYDGNKRCWELQIINMRFCDIFIVVGEFFTFVLLRDRLWIE